MDDIPVIKDYQLAEYFQELSADSLYPSAGSSAAMTAAHAAALFAMVCRVNLRKIREDSSKGKQGSENRKRLWEETLHQADMLIGRSLSLAQEDGFAIKDFVEGCPQGPAKATDIPLEIARCAGKITALITNALRESYARFKQMRSVPAVWQREAKKPPSQWHITTFHCSVQRNGRIMLTK